MSETKHTKTPWKRSKYGKVCGPDGKTIELRGFSLACGGHDSQPDIDDDFVFRAVNAYDADQAKIAALVEALKFYADDARYNGTNQPLIGKPDQYQPDDQTSYLQDVRRDGGDIARAALKLAESGQ